MRVMILGVTAHRPSDFPAATGGHQITFIHRGTEAFLGGHSGVSTRKGNKEVSHGTGASGLGRNIEGNRQCIQCP
jgi:hypothetical protein